MGAERGRARREEVWGGGERREGGPSSRDRLGIVCAYTMYLGYGL